MNRLTSLKLSIAIVALFLSGLFGGVAPAAAADPIAVQQQVRADYYTLISLVGPPCGRGC